MTRDALHVTAYSDSKNDLPLLRYADTPVAVSPDAQLLAWATEHRHRVISLRSSPDSDMKIVNQLYAERHV